MLKKLERENDSSLFPRASVKKKKSFTTMTLGKVNAPTLDKSFRAQCYKTFCVQIYALMGFLPVVLLAV
jgi:hypothetical protein